MQQFTNLETSEVRSALNMLQEKTAVAFSQLETDIFIKKCFDYASKHPQSNMAALLMRVLLEYGLSDTPTIAILREKRTKKEEQDDGEKPAKPKRPDSKLKQPNTGGKRKAGTGKATDKQNGVRKSK